MCCAFIQIGSGDLWRFPNNLQRLFLVAVSSLGSNNAQRYWIGDTGRISFWLKDASPSEQSKAGLSALDYIRVIYNVPWPLNAVITPNSLIKYSKVLVYLMKLQWVKKRLEVEGGCRDRSQPWKCEALRHRVQLRRTMIAYCSGFHQFAMVFVGISFIYLLESVFAKNSNVGLAGNFT
jgi:hypothetical protein